MALNLFNQPSVAARTNTERSMMRDGLILAAATLLLGSVLFAQEAYRVVVNPANPVSSLSKAEISRLFLEQAKWDDGVAVAPVELLPTSTLRRTFAGDVFDLSVTAAADRQREAWKASGGNPPPAVASDRDVLAYVRLKPGAIGYVSLDADVQGVKVISVGGRPAAAGLSAGAGPQPIAVGGDVAVPQKVQHAQPVYPEFARLARVQGTVELEVVIGSTGRVERARVVRSIAVERRGDAAVKQ